MGSTSGAGTTYPSGAPVFSGVHITRSLVLYVLFCRSLFVLSAIALSFLLRLTDSNYLFGIFDLRILMTSLVSLIYGF